MVVRYLLIPKKAYVNDKNSVYIYIHMYVHMYVSKSCYQNTHSVVLNKGLLHISHHHSYLSLHNFAIASSLVAQYFPIYVY